MKMLNFTRLAGGFGFLGVALGAFGAHGLKDRLLASGQTENWETATLYLFVHALALLLVASQAKEANSRKAVWICAFWSVGVLIFCGTLYTIALTEFSKLGMITPIGGASFLGGWLILAWAGLIHRDPDSSNG